MTGDPAHDALIEAYNEWRSKWNHAHELGGSGDVRELWRALTKAFIQHEERKKA